MMIHKKIASLLIPDSGHKFTGKDFRSLLNPCVYLFMKEGVPLYVGMSSYGITRPSQSNHRQSIRARKECDEVLIYPCISIEAAYELERILIGRTQPQYNRNSKQHHAKQLLGNSLYANNISQ